MFSNVDHNNIILICVSIADLSQLNVNFFLITQSFKRFNLTTILFYDFMSTYNLDKL